MAWVGINSITEIEHNSCLLYINLYCRTLIESLNEDYNKYGKPRAVSVGVWMSQGLLWCGLYG